MKKAHVYKTNLVWTGNLGDGTSLYNSYSRAHEISANGRSVILGSSDPHFRGDNSRYNPEILLVASLSSCHMLWYLHLCADAKIVVTGYEDNAEGKMVETVEGGGHFTEVILRPQVTITGSSDQILAEKLHEKAHHLCFIANSVNFPVLAKPTILFDGKG